MVTADEEISLAYLLDPTFQLVNSAGKPLTNGWIEVYYHGTRTKYYCYSDWNGALHPFQIPLDSLGANIVLADPGYAYDIYVYNAFGSLVMSRYNVNPGQGGGGGGGTPSSDLPEHWIGHDGAEINIASDAVNVCLPMPSSGNFEYEGTFLDHSDETNLYLKTGIYAIEAVIQFTQASWDLRNSLDNLKITTGDGDTGYYWQEDLTGPEANSNIHERKVTFIRKVTGEDPYPFFISPSLPVQLNGVKIAKLSIVKLGSGAGGGAYKYLPGDFITIENRVISVTGVQPASGMSEYVTNDTFNTEVTNIYNDITNVTGDVENITNIVNNVTGDIQTIEGDITVITGNIEHIEGDITNITGDIQEITNIVNNVTGDVTNITEEITNIENNISNVTGDITEITNIVNGVTGDVQTITGDIQSVSSIIQSVSADAQVQSDWAENDSSDLAYIKNKPDEVNLQAGENITLTRSGMTLTISASQDLSDYATHSELASVSGDIQNEITNVTGDIQSITNVVNNVTGDIQNIEGDVTNLTTIVNGVTGDITDVSGQIAAVSAEVADIPEQVNADWDATEGKAEILNKPDLTVYATHDEVATVSGEIMNNVTGEIADVTNIINNVTGDIQNIEGDITNLTTVVNGVTGDVEDIRGDLGDVTTIVNNVTGDVQNLTTIVNGVTGDVEAVSAAIGAVSAAIPDAQVQSDWTELDTDSKAYIQHKPQTTELTAGDNITITEVDGQLVISASGGGEGDVTEAELEAVSGQLEANIQSVSGAIDAVSAAIPDAQVNADWAATGGVAEILNKPTEVNIIPGSNITIVETAEGVVISSTGGGGGSGDISRAEVAAATGVLEGEIQTVSAAVDTVSGQIPQTEALIAGENITIQETASGVVISSTGGGEVSEAELASVSGQLEADIQTVSGAVDAVSAAIPEYTGASGITVDNENDVISLETPVDVVAGPGIVIDNPDGNTLRISAEADAETVLYDGNGTGVSACVFSESLLNFSEIKIMVGNISGSEGLYFIHMPAKEFTQIHLTYNAGGGGNEYFVGCYGSMSSTGISLTKCVAVRSPYSNGTPATTIDNNSVYMPCIHKVVGVHRIANG